MLYFILAVKYNVMYMGRGHIHKATIKVKKTTKKVKVPVGFFS